MRDYTKYYDLWRQVADRFGVPGGCSMQPDVPVRMIKTLEVAGDETPMPGVAIAYQMYKGGPETNGEEGPPTLQFRPDALSREEGFPGEPALHYEWVLFSAYGMLEVGLHFHFTEPARNRRWMSEVSKPPPLRIRDRIIECETYVVKNDGLYKAGWASMRFPLDVTADTVLLAADAAYAMEHLIAHTWGSLEGWDYG